MAYGSNIFTGGTPTANAAEAGHEASYAFDGIWDTSTNYWYAGAAGGPPSWIKYDLGVAITKILRKLVFQVNEFPDAHDYDPADYTIDGSNNDSDWTNLATVSAGSYATGEKVVLEFANSTAFRYYRMNITQTGGTHAPPIIEEIGGYEVISNINYLKYYRRTRFPGSITGI